MKETGEKEYSAWFEWYWGLKLVKLKVYIHINDTYNWKWTDGFLDLKSIMSQFRYIVREFHLSTNRKF